MFTLTKLQCCHFHFQVIEVDYDYEEGSAGVFMPILRECVIENVVVTDGAPLTLKIKGYPESDKSIIRMTFRNISFNGITEDPHFILQNVTEILDENVYVNGRLWKISSTTSSATTSAVSTLSALLVIMAVMTNRTE